MAKATISGIITTVEGPAGSHVRPDAKTMGVQLSFSTGTGGAILTARKPRKNNPSSAQSLQRLAYSDCDCLWKLRDPQQVQAWTDYVTRAQRVQREGLDPYRLFMSDCLKFDLREYLERHLFAVWRLVNLARLPTAHRITIRMGSILDNIEPPATWEPWLPGARLI